MNRLLLLCLFTAVLAQAQPSTMFPPVRGTREMIGAGNNFQVEAGWRMLTSGGNAMWDATIETDWLVTKNFLTGIALGYSDGDTVASVWQVAVRGKRSF